jgi:outer membrane protein assembly factor BamD (BamD/ComL family)
LRNMEKREACDTRLQIRRAGKRIFSGNGSKARTLTAIATFVFFLFAGCATVPDSEIASMGKSQIFQKAYESMDSGDFEGALKYYTSYKQLFPDDLAGNLWASYEIAFIYHKMGNDAKSVTLFEELVARYDKEGTSAWPQAQRILAERVLGDIKKSQEAAATEKAATN